MELKLDGARGKPHEVLQRYTLSKIDYAGCVVAIERVTPKKWPLIRKRLEGLIQNEVGN